jgi:nicotinate-nucleotide adenylyltransferase
MERGPTTRVGIFGGAFDPVHAGHVAICREVARKDLVDELLVMPCWAHPFDKPMASYAHRVAMVELALGTCARVQVSRIEEALGGVSYTVRTVRALQQQRPDAQYALIVGDDIHADFDTWEEPDWLRAHVTFIHVPRGQDSAIPDVSSRNIRERIGRGDAIEDLVPPFVEEYIARHALYK